MALGSIAAGAAGLGAAANYFGAKEQAGAQKKAARIANAPYRQKKPYLKDLYEMGGEAVQQAQNIQTPQALQQGLEQQNQLAQQLQQQGYGQGVSQHGQDIVSGKYLNPESNPALQQYIQAAMDPVNQNFQREVLPEVSGGAAEAGQPGSSRQGVIEANAMNDLNRNLSNMASDIVYQNYENERQRMMQAPEVLQQGAQMQMTPGTIQQDVGQQQLQLETQAPFRGLQEFGQILGVGPNQQQTPGPTPSPMQNAIGGGIGGASMATGIMTAINSAGQQKPQQPTNMGMPQYNTGVTGRTPQYSF